MDADKRLLMLFDARQALRLADRATGEEWRELAESAQVSPPIACALRVLGEISDSLRDHDKTLGYPSPVESPPSV